MSKSHGFTLNEVLISVFILGLIASASVVNLRTARQRDELESAVRVIAADLRSLQSRALSAQNVKSCLAGAVRQVCELSQAGCTGACSDASPIAVGAHFTQNTTSYTLFAEVEPTKNEWEQTDATEVFLTRDLSKSGGTNTQITTLNAGGSPVAQTDISFQRQNGSLGIDGCYAPCASPVTLVITVAHSISGVTRTVSANAYTGRISID
jgi:prepilin-type N-terminal cleavage/methylation domain-containing protein